MSESLNEETHGHTVVFGLLVCDMPLSAIETTKSDTNSLVHRVSQFSDFARLCFARLLRGPFPPFV